MFKKLKLMIGEIRVLDAKNRLLKDQIEKACEKLDELHIETRSYESDIEKSKDKRSSLHIKRKEDQEARQEVANSILELFTYSLDMLRNLPSGNFTVVYDDEQAAWCVNYGRCKRANCYNPIVLPFQSETRARLYALISYRTHRSLMMGSCAKCIAQNTDRLKETTVACRSEEEFKRLYKEYFVENKNEPFKEYDKRKREEEHLRNPYLNW